MNPVEIAATIFGLLCVWLTVKQNIWCWPTGLVMVVLYISIFYEAKLYSDVILQVFYIFVQFYGWYYWLHGGKNRSEVPVTKMTKTALTVWTLIGIVGTLGWGYFMNRFTDASIPYGDAFTTVISIVAQWLMAKKVLESWWYWIAVDVVAVGVYFVKGLYLTTGLYAVFLGLAIAGYIAWRKSRIESLVVV